MRRTIVCLALLLVALGAAFLATRARRLGLRVETFAVAPGGDIDNAPKLGDDLPFAPFRFAVVSRVEGDHAALGRAMDAIRERGSADFVVLMGDVLRDGDDTECAKLAAACRDRGVPIVAIPGLRDVDAARLDEFQTWMNGASWWFVRREVFFFGAESDLEAIELWRAARQRSADTPDVGLSVIRTPSTDWPSLDWVGSRPSADENSVAVDLMDVRDNRKGSTRRRILESPLELVVPRRATPASLWRDLALGALFPLVRGTAGYVAFLGACAVIAAVALTRLRPARPAAPTGTASRTAS
jgi:hypothetical protein